MSVVHKGVQTITTFNLPPVRVSRLLASLHKATWCEAALKALTRSIYKMLTRNLTFQSQRCSDSTYFLYVFIRQGLMGGLSKAFALGWSFLILR